MRNFAQVVVHQGHIGGFDGGIRTSRSHGKTDVGARQGWGVVDAIADHAHFVVRRQAFDFGLFVFGQHIAFGFIYACLLGDGAGGVGVVAREHDGFDAQIVQLLNGAGAAVFDGVGHSKQRQSLGRRHQSHHGFALGFQRIDLRGELRRIQALFF